MCECVVCVIGMCVCVRVTRRDARAYIRPPVTQNETGRAVETKGIQGTPEGRQGVHPTPLQCTKSRACHAKATGRAAETNGHRRDTGGIAEGSRGVHPTPLQCTKSRACHAKATQKPLAERCSVCGMCVCVGDVCVSVCCVCLWDMCE